MYCPPDLYYQEPEEFYCSNLDDFQDMQSSSFITNLKKELINVCKTVNSWGIKLWQNIIN